jgi:hypothetical protein
VLGRQQRLDSLPLIIAKAKQSAHRTASTTAHAALTDLTCDPRIVYVDDYVYVHVHVHEDVHEGTGPSARPFEDTP